MSGQSNGQTVTTRVRIINIKTRQEISGSGKTIFECHTGEKYLGPSQGRAVEILIARVTDSPMADGMRHIVEIKGRRMELR
jgi:hypothetical protein